MLMSHIHEMKKFAMILLLNAMVLHYIYDRGSLLIQKYICILI